jgi:hypothetical protein
MISLCVYPAENSRISNISKRMILRRFYTWGAADFYHSILCHQSIPLFDNVL